MNKKIEAVRLFIENFMITVCGVICGIVVGVIAVIIGGIGVMALIEVIVK